jgi:Nuclease-related domain
MLTMIPPEYDEHTTSSAKRCLLHLLQNDPDSSDRVILHSLELAARDGGPYGEIDFVVLMKKDVVACPEVKDGRVSRQNGIWQTVDRSGKTSEFRRSPFKEWQS